MAFSRTMYLHQYRSVNVFSNPSAFTLEDYSNGINEKHLRVKAIGAVYYEIQGDDLVYSFCFVHPKEEETVHQYQKTITINGSPKVVNRKRTDINVSRKALRAEVMRKFNSSNTNVIRNGASESGKEVQERILEDISGRLKSSTRAYKSVINRLDYMG